MSTQQIDVTNIDEGRPKVFVDGVCQSARVKLFYYAGGKPLTVRKIIVTFPKREEK